MTTTRLDRDAVWGCLARRPLQLVGLLLVGVALLAGCDDSKSKESAKKAVPPAAVVAVPLFHPSAPASPSEILASPVGAAAPAPGAPTAGAVASPQDRRVDVALAVPVLGGAIAAAPALTAAGGGAGAAAETSPAAPLRRIGLTVAHKDILIDHARRRVHIAQAKEACYRAADSGRRVKACLRAAALAYGRLRVEMEEAVARFGGADIDPAIALARAVAVDATGRVIKDAPMASAASEDPASTEPKIVFGGEGEGNTGPLLVRKDELIALSRRTQAVQEERVGCLDGAADEGALWRCDAASAAALGRVQEAARQLEVQGLNLTPDQPIPRVLPAGRMEGEEGWEGTAALEDPASRPAAPDGR